MSPKVPSDIEIAQSAKPRHITAVAADLGLSADDIDHYGKYKAKLPLELASRPPKGKLVLVTAISPTPAGEGKSTVSVGLAQALRRIGTNAVLCIREPSLGPVFGVKCGAAGGGYSNVIPIEDITLHFTGQFHAISIAHALLSATMDNLLHQVTSLNVHPHRGAWAPPRPALAPVVQGGGPSLLPRCGPTRLSRRSNRAVHQSPPPCLEPLGSRPRP